MSEVVPLFSPEALAIINRQIADPAARPTYDIMSDSLHWSDEFSALSSAEKNVVLKGWAFRFLLAYRASVTRGNERAEFAAVWQQVLAHAPNWPGLLPERRGERAKHRLLAIERRKPNCEEQLDELERSLGDSATT